MKRIVVAFDGSYYSESALKFAIGMAKQTEAQLMGLFIEDLSALEDAFFLPRPPFSEAVGDLEIIEQLKRENEDYIRTNIQQFISYCSQHEWLDFLVYREKGVAIDELLRVSRYADMVVIGYVAYFSNVSYIGEDNLVYDLLKDTDTPVVVTPEIYEEPQTIILAYDGKPSSAFAIKQFSYLNDIWMFEKDVYMLSVKENEEDEVEGFNDMLEYLTLKFPDIKPEQITGEPFREILHFSETVPGPLLVMGAFDRRPFFGLGHRSVVNAMMERKAIPAFIAHR